MNLREMLNRFLLERKLFKVLRELSIFGIDDVYRYSKKIYQNEKDIKYGTDYQRSAQRALDNINDARYDTMIQQALIRLKGENDGCSITEVDAEEN